MRINLKLIQEDVQESPGFGAGTGYIIKEQYECPCGSGTVYYEKDDIPGFRDKSIRCDCKECDEIYQFSRASAIKK